MSGPVMSPKQRKLASLRENYATFTRASKEVILSMDRVGLLKTESGGKVMSHIVAVGCLFKGRICRLEDEIS